ncbi:tetratricopeptide repeat protein [Deefgea rivuli]|uniref:tetratricopeptide repeat protein n=1 Tax=Deefgea rivuli TaxID=400948 RepID=UPI0004820416|nr:tetratricopeptide repeat protein [Deefgea rivuli]
MMRSLMVSLLVLMLGACSSTTEVIKSPARIQAELAHRNALLAIRDGRIESAEYEWRSALLAYQAIDDWSGQGMARLGLAQIQLRLGQAEAAEQVLAPMLEIKVFPAVQRSQAALQMAQLILAADSPDWSRAKSYLTQARAECAQPCPIGTQILNVSAKIALREGDLPAASVAALQGLALAQTNRAEMAFSQRILAEVSLKQSDFATAVVWLDQAIVLDRQSAEPLWLLDDYRLLLEIAKQSGDLALRRRADVHLSALCAAMACTP